MGHAPRIDWETIKADWFTQNLKVDKKKRFTLEDLARKWCVSYKTLRNKASQDHWRHQLHEKIKEQSARIIEDVQSEEAATAAAVRRQQAKVARLLRDLGLRRLQTINPDHLSIRDAIELVKLGLVGERQALGLARTCAFPSPVVDSRWDSVEINIKKHSEIERLAKQWLDFMGKKNPKYKDLLIKKPPRTNGA